MIEEILVGIMLISMVIVLLLAWKWFNSLRTAFLAMLAVGKVWTGVLWAFGIDRPLFNIIIYNKVRQSYNTVTVTADQFVFTSFFITFLFTLAWPYLARYVPEPLRSVQVLSKEERRGGEGGE